VFGDHEGGRIDGSSRPAELVGTEREPATRSVGARLGALIMPRVLTLSIAAGRRPASIRSI
jgi:hypothetical protein